MIFYWERQAAIAVVQSSEELLGHSPTLDSLRDAMTMPSMICSNSMFYPTR